MGIKMKIEVRDLEVEFKNGTKAVDGVSLEIENGIFGLLGENGAGKTTLMRVLTTLLPISSGTVTFDGVPVVPENYCEIQKIIGYLPQELVLYPQLRVREALEYLGSLSGLTKAQCKEKIDYYLERTNLREHQNKKIRQLSGGMKRRVGLIQAMMGDPKILVVDEPTTGLDPEERIRIRNLLVEFAKDRVVLFSTHVIEDIGATCKNLAIMKKGKILYQGTVADLLRQSQGHIRTVEVQTEEEVSKLEQEYTICAKQYTENGIAVKIICPEVSSEVDGNERVVLEDAYMYMMNK